jgi:hypothetical protein
MPATRRAVFGLFLLAAMAASAECGHARVVEQKPSAPPNATLYFLRPAGLYAPLSPTVKINGRVVGELPAGTYFVVSRPPGHYVLEVQGGLFNAGYESDVDLAPGQIYFLEVGTQQTFGIGFQALTGALSGNRGQQLPGRGFNAPFSFFSLNPEHGRAAIATMRHAGAR